MVAQDIKVHPGCRAPPEQRAPLDGEAGGDTSVCRRRHTEGSSGQVIRFPWITMHLQMWGPQSI